MTRPAPNCFSEDNTRADALSGHQIYTLMTSGPGTTSTQLASDKAAELESTYAGVEARLRRVGETLGEAWGGASADAAQAAANPISQAMVQMQESLRQADRSLANQVYQFNYNKGQLKNIPENKPETGFWDDITPWDTDTEDAANQYNSDESHNRQVYSQFQGAARTNKGELPQQFPGVTADTLNIEIADTGGDDGQDKTGNNVGGTSRPHSSSNYPSSTGTGQPSGGNWTPPTSHTGGNDTTTSQAVGADLNGGLKTGDLPGGAGKPPVGGVIERPPNTGIPPIGVPVGPGGLNGPGGGRGPGGSAAGKFGGGAGKVGGGAGKFGGGAGSASGRGGVGGLGTGSSSGQQPGGKAGVFGGMGESGPNAAGRGAAGAAGRGGAAGMGGMGGHGQKGEGEDDLEHKSADYLVTEENTNEIIGDMPMVAPPTIGG
ncbi:hypothetical protein ACWEIJ_39125 [Lentzea sp. NPDC004789]